MIGFALVVFTSSFLLAAVAVLIASMVFERKQQAAGALQDDAPAILKMDELSSITLWDKLLAKFDFVEAMRMRVAESGVSWSVGRLTSLMLLIWAFTTALLSGVRWTPLWMDLLLACGAAALP